MRFCPPHIMRPCLLHITRPCHVQGWKAPAGIGPPFTLRSQMGAQQRWPSQQVSQTSSLPDGVLGAALRTKCATAQRCNEGDEQPSYIVLWPARPCVRLSFCTMCIGQRSPVPVSPFVQGALASTAICPSLPSYRMLWPPQPCAACLSAFMQGALARAARCCLPVCLHTGCSGQRSPALLFYLPV